MELCLTISKKGRRKVTNYMKAHYKQQIERLGNENIRN